MNTLEDLNNYSNTQLTYSDLRLPTIKFDTNYPPPTFLTIAEGSAFAAPVGANIIDLAQPAVVKATYLISFETTGFSVSFPVVSGVVVSHPTLTTWKVEGINSVDTWNLIKSPTITPPSGTSEPFSFTTVISSDLSNAVSTQVNIRISSAAFMTTNTSLDPILYRTSRGKPALSSNFTMTSKLAKMFSLQSNMNSTFTMIPTIVDFFKLSASFNVLASADLILSTTIFMDSSSSLTALADRLITLRSNQNSSFTSKITSQQYVWTRNQVNLNAFVPDSTSKIKFRNPQLTADGTRLMMQLYSANSSDVELTPTTTRNRVVIYRRSGTSWSVETNKTNGACSCIDSTGTWLGTYSTDDDASSGFKIYTRSGTTWTLHSIVSGTTVGGTTSISSDGIWLATFGGIYKRSGTTWTKMNNVGQFYESCQLNDDGSKLLITDSTNGWSLRKRLSDTNWPVDTSSTGNLLSASGSSQTIGGSLSRDGTSFIVITSSGGTHKVVRLIGGIWYVSDRSTPTIISKYTNIYGDNLMLNPGTDQVTDVYQTVRPSLNDAATDKIDDFYPFSVSGFPGTGNTLADYEFTNSQVNSDSKVIIVVANYLGSNVGPSAAGYSRIFCYTRP